MIPLQSGIEAPIVGQKFWGINSLSLRGYTAAAGMMVVQQPSNRHLLGHKHDH